MKNKEKKKKVTSKQALVIIFITDNQPVKQSDIVRHFYKEFTYLNKNSARKNISRMLSDLRKTKVIDNDAVDGDNYLKDNYWRITNE